MEKTVSTIYLPEDFKTNLHRLSKRERIIIELCSVGHSKREVASMINLSVTTVQDIKERAVEKLIELSKRQNRILCHSCENMVKSEYNYVINNYIGWCRHCEKYIDINGMEIMERVFYGEDNIHSLFA